MFRKKVRDYSVVSLVIRHLAGPGMDALVDELVDVLDPEPERRLNADVEEPGNLPKHVDVADQGELAGVVEGRREAAPLVVRTVQRVEVQAEGNGEDGVHRRFQQQALIEETYIHIGQSFITQYN
jgi:hypothetical protein